MKGEQVRQGRGSRRSVLGVALALLAVAGMVPAGMMAWPGEDRRVPATPDVPAVSPADESRARAAFAGLPLSFEANAGQHDPAVAFSSRGAAYDLFLTPTEAVFALPGQAEGPRGEASVLRMSLIGANPDPAIAGRDALAGKVNYLRGNDREQWQTGVSTYQKVAYDSVYPGVDLVYYGKGQELEYDFVVAPGADPSPIQLHFDGATDMTIDAGGDLVLDTPAGEVRQRRPHIYQDIDGSRVAVAGSFVLGAGGAVRFDLGAYDTAHPLVIDPVVTATYLGGTFYDVPEAVSADASGIYIAGQTRSSDFPRPDSSAYQTSNSCDGSGCPPEDAFVARLSPDGLALTAMTYFGTNSGGGEEETATGIAISSEGTVFIGGRTRGLAEAESFPTNVDAYDRTCTGPTATFVAEFDSNLAELLYSTCLQTGSSQGPTGMALDGGDVYLAGSAGSDFMAKNGFRDTVDSGGTNEAYLLRLDPSQPGTDSLVYATLVGGSGTESADDIVVKGGDVWLTGTTDSQDLTVTVPDNMLGGPQDGFFAGINTNRSGEESLEHLSYFGGSDFDVASDIAVGDDGDLYITGYTISTDLPQGANAYRAQGPFGDPVQPVQPDAFVARLRLTGNAFMPVYLSYLGGSAGELGSPRVAVGPDDTVYVAGGTQSEDFPRAGSPHQDEVPGESTPGAPVEDLFFAHLDTGVSGDESLLYSTFLAGSGRDVGPRDLSVDSDGNAVIVSDTDSVDFPLTPNAYQSSNAGSGDAFLVIVTPYSEAPVVDATELSPSTERSGVRVRISGSGFVNEETNVSFGDNLGTDVEVDNNGRLFVTVPGRTADAAQVDVRVAVGDVSEPEPYLLFTYEPTVGSAVVDPDCSRGFNQREITITGEDLDLIDSVTVDEKPVTPSTGNTRTQYTGFFEGDPSGTSAVMATVEVRTKDKARPVDSRDINYAPCDDGGGDNDPDDPVDPPPLPRGDTGTGNPAPPQDGGFTTSPGPGNAPTGGFTTTPGSTGVPPTGGFTTAPGSANVPTGGFTTAPGSGTAPTGGFTTAPGSANVPAGGFTNTPVASNVPSGGFTTAPGATATPSGAAFPGVTPVPGGSSVPSAGPSSPPPTPNPGAPPVAPVAGASPPGAPALGSTGDDASGAASRYSMVAAEQPLGIPPVAVAGAVMLVFFACALLVTSQAPRPGWQLAGGTGRRRPRVRGGY
jgi:hypothetical protein